MQNCLVYVPQSKCLHIKLKIQFLFRTYFGYISIGGPFREWTTAITTKNGAKFIIACASKIYFRFWCHYWHLFNLLSFYFYFSISFSLSLSVSPSVSPFILHVLEMFHIKRCIPFFIHFRNNQPISIQF